MPAALKQPDAIDWNTGKESFCARAEAAFCLGPGAWWGIVRDDFSSL